MIIRLASATAVAALLSAGTPALAEELGQREFRGASDAYTEARRQAEAFLATHHEEPTADDLGDAIAYGDAIRVQAADAAPSRLRMLARALYGVITHLILTTHPADGRT